MSGHVAHVEAHVQVPDVVATADVLGCLVGQGRRNVTLSDGIVTYITACLLYIGLL